MTRVISYTRFSSRKQAKGLSYARQIEAAKEWCTQNGHTLDEEDKFEDLGISAYSGANAATGALSRLQEMLSNGQIERGTILIVEALDRITRLSLPKAITLLMNLATSGLRVITLSDMREWNEDTMHDLGSFMMSVVTLYRGHQESDAKARRLRSTFKMHRTTGSQKAFGSAPGWLFREAKDQPWQVDASKADVVRRVFELAAAGLGSKAISKKANEEGWLVPTRLNLTQNRWHAQMPGQILRNRAVLGEHQHRIHTHEAHAKHWHGVVVGTPIPNYYPQIISHELWNRARASVRSRAVTKRRATHYYNVFSGMMFCGICGAPMHRKNEKNGYSRAQIQCSDRVSGKTKCKTMAAKCCDPHMLTAIYEHSVQELGGGPNNTLSADIAGIETEITEKLEKCAALADAIMKTKGLVQASFINDSVALSDTVEELQSKLNDMRDELLRLSTGSVLDDTFVTDALKHMYVTDDDSAKEKRAELYLKLSRVVETIWVWAYDCALIKYKGSNALHAVELAEKRLPSRANPDSKWHTPPTRKEPTFKPIYAEAFWGRIIPPKPRRAPTQENKLKPLLLAVYEDEAES